MDYRRGRKRRAALRRVLGEETEEEDDNCIKKQSDFNVYCARNDDVDQRVLPISAEFSGDDEYEATGGEDVLTDAAVQQIAEILTTQRFSRSQRKAIVDIGKAVNWKVGAEMEMAIMKSEELIDEQMGTHSVERNDFCGHCGEIMRERRRGCTSQFCRRSFMYGYDSDGDLLVEEEDPSRSQSQRVTPLRPSFARPLNSTQDPGSLRSRSFARRNTAAAKLRNEFSPSLTPVPNYNTHIESSEACLDDVWNGGEVDALRLGRAWVEASSKSMAPSALREHFVTEKAHGNFHGAFDLGENCDGLTMNQVLAYYRAGNDLLLSILFKKNALNEERIKMALNKSASTNRTLPPSEIKFVNIRKDYKIEAVPAPFKNVCLAEIMKGYHLVNSSTEIQMGRILRHILKELCDPQDAIQKFTVRDGPGSMLLQELPKAVQGVLEDFCLGLLGLDIEELKIGFDERLLHSSNYFIGLASEDAERQRRWEVNRSLCVDWKKEIHSILKESMMNVREFDVEKFMKDGVEHIKWRNERKRKHTPDSSGIRTPRG